MQFSTQRGADPFKCDVGLQIEDRDIANAFKDETNAVLFFSFLQARATWDKLKVSARLRICADVAELAEKEEDRLAAVARDAAASDEKAALKGK